MNRGVILSTALEAVCGERAATHGDCETNFQHIAEMWSAYLGIRVSAVDVAHMMVQLKQSRVRCGDPQHADHYVDQCGYSAIAGQIATRQGVRK